MKIKHQKSCWYVVNITARLNCLPRGKGIELLGGIKQFASDGERFCLNQIFFRGKPDKNISPHPEVFRGKAFSNWR